MPLIGPIPGYAEAVEREQFQRLAAFVLEDEKILGYPVKSLTPRLALELEVAGSPFFNGKLPTAKDLPMFLWHVSLARTIHKPALVREVKFRERKKRELALWLVTQEFDAVCDTIRDYITESFSDGPGGGGSGGFQYSSWTSTLVDYISSRYGWDESAILDKPFKRLWQYWRCGRMRDTEGKAVFINRISDQIKSDYVAQLQKEGA